MLQRLRSKGTWLLQRASNKLLHAFGYKLAPVGLGYLRAQRVVGAARNSGLSLAEYLEQENVGGVGRRRDSIIEQLVALHAIAPAERMVEIGPGTGMFLERVIAIARPRHIELYETATDWRQYLEDTYRDPAYTLTAHRPDGETLKQTADNSIDAVYAHGVFVYLPLLTVFSYLAECVRVVRPGGLIVFDVFLDASFNFAQIRHWQRESPHYSFPVVIARATLEEFFVHSHVTLMGEFSVNYHAARSTYLVVRKGAEIGASPRSTPD